MKRIIDGRLYDDSFMDDIGSRTFDKVDPVTGEVKTYREALKREFVIKPGHTLGDTWVEGSYGRKIVRDNCDLTKGQFVLKVSQGWSDGIFVPLSDDEARRWFEKWCPDQTDRYAEVFGPATNPWSEDGTIKLVEQAESRLSSMKWDKERAEERASKAEGELKNLREELETVKADRDNLKEKFSKVSGCPLTQAEA